MDYKIQEMYKKLGLDEKRNELNKVLLKMDNLVDQLLKMNNVSNIGNIKNYNQNESDNINEEEMLSILFSDAMLIKNKILMLLVLETE